MTGNNGTVVVAKRVDDGHPDTEEIRNLARAAGYVVAGEVTQTRTEDPALCLGEGKVAELSETVAETDADSSATLPSPRQSAGSSVRVWVTSPATT